MGTLIFTTNSIDLHAFPILKSRARLRSFLLLIFLINAVICQSQSSNGGAGYPKKTYLTGRKIEEINLQSPYIIYSVDFFPEKNQALVQLRLTNDSGDSYEHAGYMALLDLDTRTFKWEENIKTFRILRDSNILLQIRPTSSHFVYNRTYRLNLETGKIAWETKSLIERIERKQKIGIGFEYRNPGLGPPKVLNGIDLSNGGVVWSRNITTACGWNETLRLDENTLLIESDGLHSADIATGKGWDYQAKTGLEDYKLRNIGAGIDFASFLFGYPRYTPGSMLREYIAEVCSAPLMTQNFILFASAEELACLDHTGKPLWRAPFPKGQASKSDLYLNDSTVYLINNGYAVFRGKYVPVGIPFLAAYDLHSGKQRFMKGFDEKDLIIGSRTLEDGVVLLFHDRIAKYAKKDGRLLNETRTSPQTLGLFKYLVGNHVYTQSHDSVLSRLVETDTTHTYVFTAEELILSFDKNLEVSKTFASFDSCYLSFHQSGALTLLRHGKENVVMNEKKKIISRSNTSLKARLVGQTLNDVQKDRLIVIELKDIVKENP